MSEKINEENFSESEDADLVGLKKVVAITACAAGVAHTYMAQDCLIKECKKLGIDIRVETQGTIGAENVLTAKEISEADLVIIAADVKIDLSRFVGKKLHNAGVNEAIKNSNNLIKIAWKNSVAYGKKGTKIGAFTIGATKKRGVLSHLMTGISWALPLTISAGLLMAIANLCAFQTEYSDQIGNYTQDWVLSTRKFANFLMTVGGLGFKLMIPFFAAFVAYSIADKPGIAAGLIGGYIINDNSILGISVPVSPQSVIEPGAGFIGAIIVGLLSGYFVQLLKVAPWPKVTKPIVPLMIIPVISVLVISCFVKYAIGSPIASLVLSMFDGLTNIQEKFAGTSIVIALVIAVMIAFDMGGPCNKTALVFGTVIFYQSLAAATSKGLGYWDANFVPGTASQAAIAVPPLGMWLSTLIFKDKFTRNERIMGKAAFGQGIFGITEGAIPFAAADPIRIIFANVVGAAVAGVGVTLCDCKFAAGLGSPLGAFLGFIQMNKFPFWPMAWILPICLGILTTALIAGFLRKKVDGEELELAIEEKQNSKHFWKQLCINTGLMFVHPIQMFKRICTWSKTFSSKWCDEQKRYWKWAGNGISKYFIEMYISIKNKASTVKRIFRKRK